MGKHYILPALALAGGLAGFGLRLWQRTSALDPVTELFATGAPATLALWGLMAALALAALLLGRGGAAPEEPERAFHCPSTGYMTLMTAAGMCFLLAAARGLPELMEQLRAWQADPVHHIMPAVLAVTVAACLVGAVGALVSVMFFGEKAIAIVALFRICEEMFYFGISFPVARRLGGGEGAFRLCSFRPDPVLLLILTALGLGLALNMLGVPRPAPLGSVAAAAMLLAAA